MVNVLLTKVITVITVMFPLEIFSLIELRSTLFFKFRNPYNC